MAGHDNRDGGRLTVGGRAMLLEELFVALALAAVATGVAGAVACLVLGQLLDDSGGLRLGVGLMLYSSVAVPAATISALTGLGGAPLGNLALVAEGMLVASVIGPVIGPVIGVAHPPPDRLVRLLAGLSVPMVAVGVGVLFPEASLAVTAATGVRFGMCGLWLASALLLPAALPRSGWRSWAGSGYAVIAVTHTYWTAIGMPAEREAAFALPRFVGLAVLSVGVVPAARRALLGACQSRLAQLAELADVRAGLRRAEHRDHELGNSVNALISATTLLDADDRDPDELRVLRTAVAGELARLNELLHAPGPAGRSRAARDYDVLYVVRQRVALAASTGMDVRLVDVDPRLRVHGDPSVLAQVLTNVLTNCARHAPGSPVRITGSQRGRTAVLRVCDFGPGVPAELRAGLFERGVRGSTSPGRGFGLYLARRLLAGEDGLIALASRPAGAGCTVVIELPLSGYSWGGVGTAGARALHGRSPVRPRIRDVPGAVAT